MARPPANDRTTQAVGHQLKGMGCDRYEVGIRDRESGRMMNKTWTPAEVKENVPSLKRLNAQGNDIYIRPAREEGKLSTVVAGKQTLVLVDDLKQSGLDRMKADGIKPAVVIETSPNNYQAWVKMPSTANDQERREIARDLARSYGGDQKSADAHHYGRLAGFTNQKEAYRDDRGRQPYCLCRESSGQVAEKGGQLLTQARDRLVEQAKEKEVAKRIEGIQEAGKSRYGAYTPVEAYQKEAYKQAAVMQKSEGAVDWSRVDFRTCANMAKTGQYTAETLKDALQMASPCVSDRHPGQEATYAARTIQAVASRVSGAAEGLAKAAEAAKGFDRGLELSR